MPHGVRIMVAYVFLPKEAASPRLEALKEDASGLAENFGLKERDRWCETVADCAADGLPLEANSPEQQCSVATT